MRPAASGLKLRPNDRSARQIQFEHYKAEQA